MTQLERTVSILEANKELLKQFQVCSLSVFGSVARGEAGPDSDIDLLVDFEPGARIGFFAFARLQKCLEELLGTKVDLVTPDALHEGMRAEIIEESVHAVNMVPYRIACRSKNTVCPKGTKTSIEDMEDAVLAAVAYKESLIDGDTYFSMEDGMWCKERFIRATCSSI